MIEQVCKRVFKAHPHPFREMESFRQPSRDRSAARSLQDSDATISHRPAGIALNAAILNILAVAGFAMLPLADDP
jgi:hypothetical protein